MQLDEDYWTKTSVQAQQMPSKALVSIDVVEVEPLDRQFGVHPVLHVPEMLCDILQFEPMRLYAVLDGTKIDGLSDILEGSGLQYKCLFSGHTADELSEVAPYLVEFAAESALLRHTFTRDEAKQYWWDLGAAIYLQSSGEFDDVLKHLRKLVGLRTTEGTVQYLRFWDAPILRQILTATSEEFLDPLHFFGSGQEPLLKAFLLPDPASGTVAIIVPHAQSPKGQLMCTAQLKQVLRDQARDAFAASLIVRCSTKFPKTLTRLEPPAQHAMMLEGISEAKMLNISKRGAVTSYVEMRLVLGAGMHDDPMYPWVADILQRITPQNQMAAMEALVSRFADFSTKVNGVRNAHFHAALTRARAELDAPEEQSYAKMLGRVYPEKVAAMGADTVQAFLSGIRDRLTSYPNLDPASVRAFILLCFFMGHRCAEDPQYDWIASALERSAGGAGSAMDSTLVRKSKTWSDAILKGMPKQ